jgi:predicted TIM-barrel fold metal-dependent hydrolase
MRNVRTYAPFLAGAVVVVLSALQTHSVEDAQKKDTLLLRDFKPQSMLHVPVHNVLRAKFPVVDVHNHVNDARSAGREHTPPAEVLKVMDHCNIQTIVILTGQWGEHLQKVVDAMVKPYPGRFVVFTQLSWENLDAPDFSEQMVKRIDDAVARGARGLKITKELGLRVKFKDGKLLTVDDPKLDPIWAECGRLGIPVAIHVSDPEAFFHPLDGTNERYEELIDNPDWLFHGPQFPSKESIMDARNRMFAKHPNTTFISLHVGNWPEDLDYVSGVLDRYPNVFVELGARQAELGRQPRRALRFFLEYQDRILFGTDMTPTEDLYRNYFRWLETADEYFDYYTAPEQGRWKIYGMELPEEVLEKVYHLNAERIFRQFKGLAEKN